MPELPEVEGFRVTVERRLVGRTVTRVRRIDELLLRGVSPSSLRARLVGCRVTKVTRHGKQLLAFTQGRGPVLALHFGMTGHPVVDRNGDHPWDCLVVELDRGPPLRYRNARRLGSIRLLRADDVFDLLWALGPDALEAPRDWFVEALSQRRAPVKTALLNQSFIAGVGNIYADEALLAAGIRGDRRGVDIAPDEAAALWTELRRILRQAVRAHHNGRDARFPLMDLRPLASRGVPVGCPRCGRALRSSTIGGRTAYWCPRCQR